MGDLEDSVQRHPAGNARKETIWDTAWAISKAMQVGREQEQERVIKLLDQFWCQEIACSKHPVRMDWVIAAIKGETNEL
jgi:hypothetical protein